jgi:type IV fimbrial biogenesis protein FimT
MKKDNGQSLAGLLSSLAISATLIALALPETRSLLERNRQTHATNQLIGALHYARSTSVSERSTVTLCPGIDRCEQHKNWNDHVLVFIDRDHNGSLDSDDELLLSFKVPDGYKWNWSSFRQKNYLQFMSTGRTPGLNGTFTLCHEDAALRQVVINVTGRVRSRAQPERAHCP